MTGDHDDLRRVLHRYDFLCPFCYVGQHRTAIFVRHELPVVELPFRAHPDIPLGGIAAGPRNWPMYAMLEGEAREAGLPLRWPPKDPAVIDRHATESGINLASLQAALAHDSAEAAVAEAELIGRKHGAQGTPAWLVAQRLTTGFLPAAEFEGFAKCAVQLSR